MAITSYLTSLVLRAVRRRAYPVRLAVRSVQVRRHRSHPVLQVPSLRAVHPCRVRQVARIVQVRPRHSRRVVPVRSVHRHRLAQAASLRAVPSRQARRVSAVSHPRAVQIAPAVHRLVLAVHPCPLVRQARLARPRVLLIRHRPEVHRPDPLPRPQVRDHHHQARLCRVALAVNLQVAQNLRVRQVTARPRLHRPVPAILPQVLRNRPRVPAAFRLRPHSHRLRVRRAVPAVSLPRAVRASPYLRSRRPRRLRSRRPVPRSLHPRCPRRRVLNHSRPVRVLGQARQVRPVTQGRPARRVVPRGHRVVRRVLKVPLPLHTQAVQKVSHPVLRAFRRVRRVIHHRLASAGPRAVRPVHLGRPVLRPHRSAVHLLRILRRVRRVAFRPQVHRCRPLRVRCLRSPVLIRRVLFPLLPVPSRPRRVLGRRIPVRRAPGRPRRVPGRPVPVRRVPCLRPPVQGRRVQVPIHSHPAPVLPNRLVCTGVWA